MRKIVKYKNLHIKPEQTRWLTPFGFMIEWRGQWIIPVDEVEIVELPDEDVPSVLPTPEPSAPQPPVEPDTKPTPKPQPIQKAKEESPKEEVIEVAPEDKVNINTVDKVSKRVGPITRTVANKLITNRPEQGYADMTELVYLNKELLSKTDLKKLAAFLEF